MTPWKGGGQSQGRYPHKQNRRRQTYIPWVGVEPTIPVFEREKIVLTLNRTATVIGSLDSTDWTNALGRCRCTSEDNEKTNVGKLVWRCGLGLNDIIKVGCSVTQDTVALEQLSASLFTAGLREHIPPKCWYPTTRRQIPDRNLNIQSYENVTT
jgi:hypothetical protein